MVRQLLSCTLVLGLFSLAGSYSVAQEKKKAEPTEAEAMAAMMKAATPGEAHKKLASLEGNWECAVKFWMDPAKPPSEMKATTETKWIMGGRYLESKVAGSFGGMPFEGRAINGYDNVSKRYHSSWIDNMGTGVQIATGTISEDGKTITYDTECYDPVSSQKMKGRDVIKLTGKDTYTMEMYKIVDAGGKATEVKAMEITYTRKK